jgi:hypothetical protein
MTHLLPSPEAVAGNPAAALVIFFALVIAHAVADFVLQPEFLALGKNRHADLSKFFGEKTPPPGLWIHALSAHSLIHAGAVWLVTGSVVLGLVEFILHFVIDFIKCEGKTGFSVDQLLHYACRGGYVAILYFGCSCVTWSPV